MAPDIWGNWLRRSYAIELAAKGASPGWSQWTGIGGRREEVRIIVFLDDVPPIALCSGWIHPCFNRHRPHKIEFWCVRYSHDVFAAPTEFQSPAGLALNIDRSR